MTTDLTREPAAIGRVFAELCATREEMTIDDPIVGVELSDESAARAGEGAARADLAEQLRVDLTARDGMYRAAAHGCPAIPGSGAVA